MRTLEPESFGKDLADFDCNKVQMYLLKRGWYRDVELVIGPCSQQAAIDTYIELGQRVKP